MSRVFVTLLAHNYFAVYSRMYKRRENDLQKGATKQKPISTMSQQKKGSNNNINKLTDFKVSNYSIVVVVIMMYRQRTQQWSTTTNESG